MNKRLQKKKLTRRIEDLEHQVDALLRVRRNHCKVINNLYDQIDELKINGMMEFTNGLRQHPLFREFTGEFLYWIINHHRIISRQLVEGKINSSDDGYKEVLQKLIEIFKERP